MHNSTVVYFDEVRNTTEHTLSAQLSAKYPHIRTYHVRSASVRVSGEVSMIGSHQFHAQLFCQHAGITYIDPARGVPSTVMVYSRQGNRHAHHHRGHSCEKPHMQNEAQEYNPNRQARLQALINGFTSPTIARERNYRIAIAANGPYSLFHGNTVSSVLSAIVTALVRVNGVFKRELATSLTLVSGNDALICLSPCGELDNTVQGALAQVTQFIDTRVGAAAYDLGHVFGTMSGGAAGFGVACTGNKALAVTGAIAPTNDAFWIDFVAHELGHQFGMSHTWNGRDGSCTAGSWASDHAYEPGSGSTIMAYAGLCLSDNVQPTSDPYFHLSSLDEFQAFVETGAGSTCGSVTNSANSIPSVSAPFVTLTVPVQQRFVLEAAQPFDRDTGDALTYTWEQIDLAGAQSALTSPAGTQAPRFRSMIPFTDPRRVFSTRPDGSETLPTGAGEMNFAIVVRDQFSSGEAGGLGHGFWAAATVRVQVSASGPLTVVTPAASASWTQDVSELVTWSVMSTHSVSLRVQIVMSVDGGKHFPYTLAANISNNGSAVIHTPCVGDAASSASLVRVQSIPVNGSYWFADSANFNLQASGACSVTSTPPPTAYTSSPTAKNPVTSPTSTPAPTPTSISKVEWTCVFPFLEFTTLVAGFGAFEAAVKQAVVASASSLTAGNVIVRYANRLNSGANMGVLADMHADFDRTTGAGAASQLVSLLRSDSNGSQTVFTAQSGWDAGMYGNPVVSNVTLDNLTAPAQACTAASCHFVVWEAHHATNNGTRHPDVTAEVESQVIFYWTGDETVLRLPSADAFESCNMSGAINVTTETDRANKRLVWTAPAHLVGSNVWFSADVSGRDNTNTTLCEQGLKVAVHVVSAETNDDGDTDALSTLLLVILLPVLVLVCGAAIAYWCCCASSGATAREGLGKERDGRDRRWSKEISEPAIGVSPVALVRWSSDGLAPERKRTESAPWSRHFTPDGREFWYNTSSGQSRWERKAV